MTATTRQRSGAPGAAAAAAAAGGGGPSASTKATAATTAPPRRSGRVVLKPTAGAGVSTVAPKAGGGGGGSSSKGKAKLLPHSAAKRKGKPVAGRRKFPVQDRRKSKPLFLTNDEGDKVWIVTATLQDIRDKARQQNSKKKKRADSSNSRLELVNVPSRAVRDEVYDRAANCWGRHEARMLPMYGDRPWRVTVKITDPKPATSSGSGAKAAAPTPYFAWNHEGGDLRIAAWPHLLDKIPSPPRFPGYSTATAKARNKAPSNKSKKQQKKKPAAKTGAEDGRGESPDESELGEKSDEGEEPMEEVESSDEEEVVEEEGVEPDDDDDLLEAEMTSLSRLAYEERWRVPLPSVSIKWISPLNKTFATRASAWENAVQLCKQEVAIDKALHGYSANGAPLKPGRLTNKVALTAGRYRFERDGLWVVGQEESWQSSRMLTQAAEAENDGTAGERNVPGPRHLSPLAYYLKCNRKAHQANRLAQVQEEQRAAAATASTPAPASPVGVDAEPKAENEAETLWVPSSLTPAQASFTLRDAERELREMWQQLSDDDREVWRSKSKAQRGEGSNVQAQPQPSGSVTLEVTFDPCSVASDAMNTSQVPSNPTANVTGDVVAISRPATALETPTKTIVNQVRTVAVTPDLPPVEEKSSAYLGKASTSVPSTMTFPESTRWKMTPEQCKLCYDAGMDHLDRIMRTVQARDLVRELQDGFDLLRERGRGRYDMELPDFDTPAFSFLSDLKKAPWMPIVREILGKDVVLIHKGMFLALPGAERQVYHQDGVHLTTQYQRDVHAINVFVPVVDMTAELGPTEFCLGSHLLGNEDFNEKFLESPIVKAGTPIIFDYRLGHRGLANISDRSCRPIVYCTYARASDGKEFRDTVNFSRKRYHKIGDLVAKVATREERARKRDELCQASCDDGRPEAKRSCLHY